MNQILTGFDNKTEGLEHKLIKFDHNNHCNQSLIFYLKLINFCSLLLLKHAWGLTKELLIAVPAVVCAPLLRSSCLEVLLLVCR